MQHCEFKKLIFLLEKSIFDCQKYALSDFPVLLNWKKYS